MLRTKFQKLAIILSAIFSLVLNGCGSAGQGAGDGSTTLDNLNFSAPITSLEILPANPVLGLATDVQVSVYAIGFDGSRRDVTKLVKWANNNASVLSAGSVPGQFRANVAGLAALTATLANHRATVDVTVSPAALVSLQFDPPLASLPAGVITSLKVIGIYDDGTTHDLTSQADWASADTGVATLSNDDGSKGRLAVLSAGTTALTASVGGRTLTENFVASNALLQSLAILAPASGLPVGTSAQFFVNGTYSDGSVVDLTMSALWTSGNPAVASANFGGTFGNFLALGQGASTVTAQINGRSASATINVTAAILLGVSISPTVATVPAGLTQVFTATGHYSDGNTADVTSLAAWTSDAFGNAWPVNGAPGSVKGLVAGSAVIGASYQGMNAAAALTVTNAQVASLRIVMSNDTVSLGMDAHATAIATYSDGSSADVTSDVQWASGDVTVAAVSNADGTKGRIAGAAVGATTLTASLLGQQAQAPFTVSAATLTGFTVTGAGAQIAKGTGLQITAVGTLSDGSTVDLTNNVAWSISDTALASVDTTTRKGTVTGLAPGSVTVAATYNGQTVSVPVSITAPNLTGLLVDTGGGPLAKGLTRQITATGTYSDGSTVNLTFLGSWSTGTPSLASVGDGAGSKGMFKGLGLGVANVTVTYGGRTASGNLTVSAPVLTSLSVNPGNGGVGKGFSRQLSVNGYYSDGTAADLTEQATWTSALPAVGSVSDAAGSKGLFQALAVGDASITAAYQGLSDVGVVRVDAASLLSIAINAGTGSVAKGTDRQLTATGTYSDGTTADITSQVSWASSNASLGTVGDAAANKGLFHAAGLGSATITASLGNVSISSPVAVGAAALSGLSVAAGSGPLSAGLTRQLSATGTYSDGTSADITSQVSWSSSAPSIASVDDSGSKGLVTGLLAGAATITASLNGVSATGSVTVTAANLTGISLNVGSGSLASGLSRQLTATGTYSDGTTADITLQVSWSTTTASFATVNNAGNKGLLQALAAGSAQVSASLNGLSAQGSVVITAANLTGITLNVGSGTLASGLTRQLSATGTYTDGSSADVTAQAQWSATSPTLGTVNNSSSKGLFQALSAGSAGVSVSLNGLSAQGTVVVGAADLTGISLSVGSGSLASGLTRQLTATGTYTDGSTADITVQAAWATTTPTIASVNNGASKGLLTGLAAGSANVSASLNGLSAQGNVTVVAASLAGISLNVGTGSLASGLTRQLTATGTYSDGSTADITALVSWSTTTPTLGTVNNAGTKGLFKGLAAGTAAVSASLNGLSAQGSITVTAPALVSLAVTNASGSVAKGLWRQLGATGTYTDGSTADVTAQAAWTSASPAIGSVGDTAGSKGNFRGLGLGSTTVSASLGGISGSAPIDVSAAVLQSIAVNGGSVAKGLSLQLAATGTYSDGTTADVTSQAAWTSASPSVGTVDSPAGTHGLFKGVAMGNANVTAAFAGVQGSGAVTVTAPVALSVTVNPANVTVLLLAVGNLTATAQMSDGTSLDVTATATWGTSDPALLSLSGSSAGRLTALQVGSGNITATYQGKTGTCTVRTVTSLVGL